MLSCKHNQTLGSDVWPTSFLLALFHNELSKRLRGNRGGKEGRVAGSSLSVAARCNITSFNGVLPPCPCPWQDLLSFNFVPVRAPVGDLVVPTAPLGMILPTGKHPVQIPATCCRGRVERVGGGSRRATMEDTFETGGKTKYVSLFLAYAPLCVACRRRGRASASPDMGTRIRTRSRAARTGRRS